MGQRGSAHRRRTALLLAGALVLGACGADDDNSDDADVEATTDSESDDNATGGAPATTTGDDDTGDASAPTTGDAPAPTTGDDGAAAPDGGTLVLGIGSEPETLDPHRTRAGTDNYFLLNAFEHLLSHDPDGELVGGLAESWEASADGLSYTFTLRDATFHNGDPVTAEDVKFSLERYADPDGGNVFAYNLAGLDSIEVVDDRTVTVNLVEPDGAFLTAHAYALIVPKAYVEEVGDEGFAEAPVGSGPWQFESRSIRESVTLNRFDGYWGDLPGYSILEMRIIGDDNARVAAMRSGEVDVIAQVPPQSIGTLEQTDGVKVVTSVTGDNIFWIFNMLQEAEPWGDPRVRQALAMAIDQDAIYSSVLGELAVLMSGVSPLNVGWDESAVEQEPYDPEGARALLEEAGYGDGFSMDLFAPVNGRLPNSEQVAQAIAGFWSEVGVNVNVQLVAYGQYVDMERAGSELNGVVMGLWGDSLTFDPQARLVGTMTCDGPYSHTCDPELDAMITTVRTEIDPDARVQAYKDAFDYINERDYAIWSYTSEGAFAMKDDVDWQPYHGIPYTRMGNARPAS